MTRIIGNDIKRQRSAPSEFDLSYATQFAAAFLCNYFRRYKSNEKRPSNTFQRQKYRDRSMLSCHFSSVEPAQTTQSVKRLQKTSQDFGGNMSFFPSKLSEQLNARGGQKLFLFNDSLLQIMQPPPPAVQYCLLKFSGSESKCAGTQHLLRAEEQIS